MTFEKLTFTPDMMDGKMSQDFVYTIREEQGTESDIRYDEEVYEVTVHVEDDLAGQLTAEVTSVKDRRVMK